MATSSGSSTLRPMRATSFELLIYVAPFAYEVFGGCPPQLRLEGDVSAQFSTPSRPNAVAAVGVLTEEGAEVGSAQQRARVPRQGHDRTGAEDGVDGAALVT